MAPFVIGIFDSGIGGLTVAREIKKFKGKDVYYLTDVRDRFIKTAKLFLGKDLSDIIEKVEL